MQYSAINKEPKDDHVKFILEQVAKAGDTVQTALVEQNEVYFGDAFKRIRRPLPITRTKMDWYFLHINALQLGTNIPIIEYAPNWRL